MRIIKPLATALALSVGALTFAAPAQADHRWNRHHHGGGHAAAAGIIGFAAGAILGGALSAPRHHRGYYYGEPEVVYVEPRPVYVRPAPVYRYALEPWTPEWYAYCESEYRSFDPDTGYYKGYDKRFHFCQ